ncbi:hypothetical protein D3C85_566540 [compost metagenome]
MVGAAVVAQTIPLCTVESPPSALTLPPITAETALTLVAVAVVTVATTVVDTAGVA